MKKYVHVDWVTPIDLPENILSLVGFLQEKLLEIPEEYRADAEITFDIPSDYESGIVDIDLYYMREETEEEKEERSRKSMRAFEREVNEELALLKKLKAKYEGERNED